MKKFLMLQFIILVSFLVSSTCFAELDNKPTIAVLPFYNHSAVSKINNVSYKSKEEELLIDSNIASDKVIDDLLDSNYANIVNLDKLENNLTKNTFNSSGKIDTKNAVKIGEIIGAQYIICGRILYYSLQRIPLHCKKGYGCLGMSPRIVVASVMAMVIDVKTGRVVGVAIGHGESRSSSNEIQWHKNSNDKYCSDMKMIKLGTAEVSRIQVYNAIAKAADDLMLGKRGLLPRFLLKLNADN